MITIGDMERTIAELFPNEVENVEINELILLDYKVGSNKKGYQFIAVFTSLALLEAII